MPWVNIKLFVWWNPTSLELESTLTDSFINFNIQGDFFNWASPENVSRLAPPNLLGLGPPKFYWRWNHIHFARHLVIFDHGGGSSLGL